MSKQKSTAAMDNRDEERKNKGNETVTFGYEFMADEKMAELGFGGSNSIYSQLRDDVIYLLKSSRAKGDKKLVIFPKGTDGQEITKGKLTSMATMLRQMLKKTGLPYDVSVLMRRQAIGFIPQEEKKG
jgi:hypothetical protein